MQVTKKIVGALGGLSLGVASAAQAALPPAIALGITEMQADALDLVDLVWPFVLALSFAIITFKIYKRVISKA